MNVVVKKLDGSNVNYLSVVSYVGSVVVGFVVNPLTTKTITQDISTHLGNK